MARLLLPFALLAAVVALVVAADRPQPPADFTFVNRGDTKTLDLQRMSWMQDMRIANTLFEGLVRHDVFSWDYRIVPGVAERWELSPDGRTYTFHLRADARWSNGAPVTAHDFVFSWRRGLLPDTASDYANFFLLIQGAREFYDWRAAALERFGPGDSAAELWARTEARFDRGVGLHAPDARTLRVTLARPVPYFLDLCATPVMFPVYPPLVRQYDWPDPRTGRLAGDQGWTKPPRLVSNGAFMLTLWRFKRDMRLEKNPYYWDAPSLAIDSIAIPSINDGNAAVLAFQTGAVDWVSDVTTPYKGDMWAAKRRFYDEHRAEFERLEALGLDQFEIDRRLPDDPRKNIHAIPTFGTYWWNFNCRPALPDGRPNPFHDPRVRRAFAMVVDKESIVRNVKRCGEPVARALVPPGSIPGYTPPAGLPCLSDFPPGEPRRAWVERARALLREAGWGDMSRFPTVELLFNKDSGHDLVAQSIARDWETHLGAPTSLAQKELKVFADDLKNGNFMTSRAGWYGDYGDPTTFLELSRSTDGNNDRKYDNPAFDALLDRAAAEPDPAARLALLAQGERMLMDEDLPMIPLHHYVTLYLFDPDEFTGLNCHPRTSQLLREIDAFGDGQGSDRPKVMRAGAADAR